MSRILSYRTRGSRILGSPSCITRLVLERPFHTHPPNLNFGKPKNPFAATPNSFLHKLWSNAPPTPKPPVTVDAPPTALPFEFLSKSEKELPEPEAPPEDFFPFKLAPKEVNTAPPEELIAPEVLEKPKVFTFSLESIADLKETSPEIVPPHEVEPMAPPEEPKVLEKISEKTPDNPNIFTFTLESIADLKEAVPEVIPPQKEKPKPSADAVKLDLKQTKWAREKAKPVEPAEPDVVKPKKGNYKTKRLEIDSDEQPARPKRKPKHLIKPKKSKDIFLPTTIKLSNLSLLLGVHYEDMRRKMSRAGLPDYRHDYLLTSEDASLIAMEFNMNPMVDEHQAKDLYPQDHPETDAKGNAHPLRAPIVTIMGHVDHGKTTLLDTLRKTSVAAGEAGGITQHIGAFQVRLSDGQLITFLDTPGHAAFRSMRARGAKATDLIVLVIAADDGIMPQTIEAIEHALEADVPMIVAITKCDKPTRNLAKIKEDLAKHSVFVEDFGGETQIVEISAPTGMGLDTLQETILTLAEVMELRSPVDCATEAVVLEAHVARGLGPVATVVVKNGTLRPNQFLVAGNSWCKVRNILNENGKPLSSATPGMPAQIVGWRGPLVAGDIVLQAQTEDEAKTVVENRSRKGDVEMELKQAHEINERRQKTTEEDVPLELPVLPIVLKADVSGSVEAIEECIAQLPSGKVIPRVVQRGVGPPTKADVDVAVASSGVVTVFNLKVDRDIINMAHFKKVNILNHTIIYKLLEDVQEKMLGLLPTTFVFKEEAQLEVLQVFEMKFKGRSGPVRIAGCRVNSGTLLKSHLITLTRPGEEDPLAQELEIEVLKHHKDDITSAKAGLECALELKRFTKFKVGDILTACTKSEAQKSLK